MRQILRWQLILILVGCGIATCRAAAAPASPAPPEAPAPSIPFPSAPPPSLAFPSATAPAPVTPTSAPAAELPLSFPGTVVQTPLPAPATRSSSPTTRPASAATQPGETLISLNFPDGVPLKTLIDYVSMRLGINVLYDEQSVAKKLTIKAPAKIPESWLMGLLESALKMNELAIVDTDQKGWKRIVPAQNLVAISRAPKEQRRVAG